jgi:DNA-binding beta-propeller fold protein YncE
MVRLCGACLLTAIALTAGAAACTSAPVHRATVLIVVPNPGCSTSVTTGKPLGSIRPVTARLPGKPFGAISTTDGRWVFASTWPDSIAVMAAGPGTLRSVRILPSPVPEPAGLALTNDGQFLLVAGDNTAGAVAVLRVATLEDGGADPLVGLLRDDGTDKLEVAVSPDGQYVYVTDEEQDGGLSVFNLARALRDGFSAPGVAVGIVPLPPFPVGVTVSPDGSLVYVVSYVSSSPDGRLSVISAARADAGADGTAVLTSVNAGCEPVRVALSPDGGTAWVTAQESNALLAYSTADLRHDPAHALLAVIPVGSAPTGLVIADNGRVALVGNSNRSFQPSRCAASPASQTVSVIDTADALAHRPSLAGAIPAGLFPRDMTIDPAGQVMLANYCSGTVETFPAPKA